MRVQTNGFYDYNCLPVDPENNQFQFPMFAQYSAYHEKYFLTHTVELAEENESNFDGIISEHPISLTSVKKCLSKDIPFTTFDFVCKRLSSLEVVDECVEGLDNCQFFEQCIDTDIGFVL